MATHEIKQNKNKNKQVQNLLRHLPENIAAFRLECSECSKQFRPNWFKLSNEPLIPVKPNDHDGPGRWIPIKTYEICPFCEEAVPLDLPVVQMQSKVMLFGDEAYREEQGKLIFRSGDERKKHRVFRDWNFEIREFGSSRSFSINSKSC